MFHSSGGHTTSIEFRRAFEPSQVECRIQKSHTHPSEGSPNADAIQVLGHVTMLFNGLSRVLRRLIAGL
jgi:hypothetical protein